jgi:hypothetical protein
MSARAWRMYPVGGMAGWPAPRAGPPGRRPVAGAAQERGQLLPLSGKEKLYVAGSNGDDIGNQAGAWTVVWQGLSGDIIPRNTILEGIRQVSPTAWSLSSPAGRWSSPTSSPRSTRSSRRGCPATRARAWPTCCSGGQEFTAAADICRPAGFVAALGGYPTPS